MRQQTRRDFLATSGAAVLGASLGSVLPSVLAQIPGERPQQDASVKVLNPRDRVPVSLIIDDSTCLVNLNRFAIPQFAAAWNDGRYDHDWRKMPLEIPDSFVRRFGEWCAEAGVKGKYSIVPYPACVGRLDREVPGWTRKEIVASIDLVKELMLPNWDIHPEMVTHTRVIDIKTGHPYPMFGPKYCENWQWTDGKSVDEIADYMRYALTILKNIDLPCEGVTTPGGFGNRVLPELSQATLMACRDIYNTEIPHYFRHLYSEGERSVAPRVEYASDIETDDPKCVVSIIGCTGDWTGGWDCSDRGHLDRFITADLSSGRMVDVITRGEPAVMVCHWTGIHFNGEEVGFEIFREVVKRLHERFDNLVWMKNSEIARYWAAKELTRLERVGNQVTLTAPFACPAFTLQVPIHSDSPPKHDSNGITATLQRVDSPRSLAPGTFHATEREMVACIDLPKGVSHLNV
ncbi:MAG: twin-arginine translocation signal domain-containing protein [Planctomycetales bacterium]|nr:twin-arginine translocation signal domain-containing protein [Planctomycetales bacterium]